MRELKEKEQRYVGAGLDLSKTIGGGMESLAGIGLLYIGLVAPRIDLLERVLLMELPGMLLLIDGLERVVSEIA